MRNKQINENGFTHIVILVLVLAVVASLGFVSYVKVKSSQDDKRTLSQQKASENALELAKQKSAINKAAEAKKAADAEAAKPVEVTSAPVEVASPVVVATPVEVASPVVATSNATAYTGCDGITELYVSNKNGTTSSYQPPPNWTVVKTYVYGEKIIIYCQPPANEYVFDNDAYVKRVDLSPTKP